MEKIQLDDLTFINVFNKNDFKDEETLQGIISSCEKIIKSYKEIFDPSSDIDEFKDNITNFFLGDSKFFACILYSKKDCDPGKRRPISFAYFSSKDKEEKIWKLESVYNKFNAEMDFKKNLVLSSFKYLKDKNADQVITPVKVTNKDEQKFFTELKKEFFPEQNNVENESEKLSNFVSYTFDLEPFKFILPKYDEKTA